MSGPAGQVTWANHLQQQHQGRPGAWPGVGGKDIGPKQAVSSPIPAGWQSPALSLQAALPSKAPRPGQDSLQTGIYSYIFCGILHKAGYYISGNSLMIYRAMGRFSSLTLTALHSRHGNIDCISAAPRFGSFNRGFAVVVFPSIARMSLLKYISLAWYHGWSISLAVKYPLCHQVQSQNQFRNTPLAQ